VAQLVARYLGVVETPSAKVDQLRHTFINYNFFTNAKNVSSSLPEQIVGMYFE
jgi:hypothetical protein